MQYPLERVAVSPVMALTAIRARSAHLSDPRGARAGIHKNVSIVETCRFYGVADALTSCRVPRSCRDCLAMPGCVLLHDGVCDNATDPMVSTAYDYDYHAALTDTDPHGPGYNRTLVAESPYHTFFAANATYCEPSDAVCSSCSAKFRSLARSKSTVNTLQNQFCVGTNGCVCIAVCEATEVQASRARDKACYGADWAIPPPLTTLDRPKLPNFSSRRREPRFLPPVAVRRTNASCGYYEEQDLRGCRAPRSCRDCLAREGCMISGYTCVDAATYDPALDFRNSSALTSTNVMFPSANTKYCPQDDATCAACRADFEAKRLQSVGAVGGPLYGYNTTFCVGADGCVCIELCENAAFIFDNARDGECHHAERRTIGGDYLFVLGALAIFLTVGHVVMWWRDGRPPRPRRAQPSPTAAQLWRHMLDRAPEVLQLDLFGWRRYHRELEEKELALLAGAQDLSPVARPMGFDCTDPTAPDFDDDDSSAPLVTNPTALASAPMYQACDRSPIAQVGMPTASSFDDE